MGCHAFSTTSFNGPSTDPRAHRPAAAPMKQQHIRPVAKQDQFQPGTSMDSRYTGASMTLHAGQRSDNHFRLNVFHAIIQIQPSAPRI